MMRRMNYHTRTPSRDRDDVARALAGYVLERSAPAPRDEFDVADYVDAIARGDDRQISRIREQSERIADRLGVQPQAGGLVFDIGGLQRRDLTAGGGGAAGGFLVGTEQAFAGNLWANSVIGAVPLTRLDGLVGNVAIAATTSITTGWLSDEATAAPDVAAQFGQRVMVPHTVAATATISHQLDRQLSPAARAHVVSQLQAAIRQAADAAVINGSGSSGEPLGIIGVSGITSVSGTSLGWSGIRDMLEAVEGRDVGGLAFVAGTTAAKLLRSRERFSGAGPILDAGRIDGTPCIVTRACPADALVLCEWPRVVVGIWGGLEVTATAKASAAAFATGQVMVRAMLSMDVALEQPSAAACAASIT